MFLGVDVGSAHIKFALLDEHCKIKCVKVYKNVGNELAIIDKKINDFLLKFGLDVSNTKIAACGYGREHLSNPDALITEITAIANGAALANKNIDCVIDIGAQDFKVIKINTKNGKVLQFFMNDKCSSGTGAFISEMLHKLDIPFKKIDEYYFKSNESVNLSATCTVFATSEAIGHLSNGETVDSVLRGMINILVRRICPLVERFNSVKNFTLTGGLGDIRGLINAFNKELELKFIPIEHARYIGAIGAAAYIAKGKNKER